MAWFSRGELPMIPNRCLMDNISDSFKQLLFNHCT